MSRWRLRLGRACAARLGGITVVAEAGDQIPRADSPSMSSQIGSLSWSSEEPPFVAGFGQGDWIWVLRGPAWGISFERPMVSGKRTSRTGRDESRPYTEWRVVVGANSWRRSLVLLLVLSGTRIQCSLCCPSCLLALLRSPRAAALPRAAWSATAGARSSPEVGLTEGAARDMALTRSKIWSCASPRCSWSPPEAKAPQGWGGDGDGIRQGDVWSALVSRATAPSGAHSPRRRASGTSSVGRVGRCARQPRRGFRTSSPVGTYHIVPTSCKRRYRRQDLESGPIRQVLGKACPRRLPAGRPGDDWSGNTGLLRRPRALTLSMGDRGLPEKHPPGQTGGPLRVVLWGTEPLAWGGGGDGLVRGDEAFRRTAAGQSLLRGAGDAEAGPAYRDWRSSRARENPRVSAKEPLMNRTCRA